MLISRAKGLTVNAAESHHKIGNKVAVARDGVLTAVLLNMQVFWDVMLCDW